LIDAVKAGQVQQVGISDNTVTGRMQSGDKFKTYMPNDPHLIDDLLANGVEIIVKPPEEPSMLMSIFVSFGPILLLIAVWVFFMRQMQGGGVGGRGGAMGFGKSKARMLDQDQNKVTFADVAGCDEAKEEVQEMVDFLRDPAKYQKLGGKVPRGALSASSRFSNTVSASNMVGFWNFRPMPRLAMRVSSSLVRS
jgi:cell division protease FtsH